MKKIVSLAVIAVMLLTGMFVFTGCGEKKEEENKTKVAAKEYTIDAKFGGKFSFEFPEDLGYEAKEGLNSITLTHKDNKSTIEVYALDTSKNSILMGEKDFSSTAYYGYKTIEIAGHEAFMINRNKDFSITYGILLEKDERAAGKYYGVKIVVSKNSLKLDEFDPVAFVETDAFKNLLNSVKVTKPEQE